MSGGQKVRGKIPARPEPSPRVFTKEEKEAMDWNHEQNQKKTPHSVFTGKKTIQNQVQQRKNVLDELDDDVSARKFRKTGPID
jgi:hypothetical protein